MNAVTNNNSATYPTLPNPPIVEALIDIQGRAQGPLTIDKLKSVADALKGEFPLLEERSTATFVFDGNPAMTPSMPVEPNGFIARTEDSLYAVQLMPDRFALSRLKPYIDWSDLRTWTEKFWPVYRDITGCERVVRLAVRYINRLLLPLPIRDFSEYFVKPIEIPDTLPQSLLHYMLRMVLPNPDDHSVANIQQVLEGVPQENQLSIIFDIDAYKTVDLAADEDHVIWKNLEELRSYKNRIFFENLTKTTIGLYR